MKKSFAVLLFMLTAGLGLRAIAQHATAFDIEDGGRAFDSSCAGCHGPDGNLIAGIDFRRGIFRRPLADDEIVAIILNGIPNTPMPATPGMSEEQAVRIVAYLRSLPESFVESAAVGDPARGREIFSGDGKCLDCHRVAGRGSRLGPDLSRIGLARRAAELESSLLDPEAEVQPTNRFYTVTPRRGAAVTGRLLNQDTFTVQLMDADERPRSFQKSALRDFGFAESPMPSYRDEFDAQALADVVSYLVSLRGESTR
jgi:putative heme-binding domain-containing protein